MKRTLLVLALAVKYVLFAAQAAGAPKVITVPFQNHGDQIAISILINDQSAVVQLDSGATVTAIDANVYKGTVIQGGSVRVAGGETKSIGVGSASVQIGDKKIGMDGILIYPGRVCSDGKDDGLLGEDILRKFASVTIDYQHKQVIFTEK
jgi:hypothetical protein